MATQDEERYIEWHEDEPIVNAIVVVGGVLFAAAGLFTVGWVIWHTVRKPT